MNSSQLFNLFLKDTEYAYEGFSRKQNADILGIEVDIISPEDSILSKLEWAKMGKSERQFRDALGVAGVQYENLDLEYLKKWAKVLNIEELLNKVLSEAKKLQ